MSEPEGDGYAGRTRARRHALDRGGRAGDRAAIACAPAVGKHTLIEGAPAEHTGDDAAAFFERAAGEARAQLAALARAIAAADRLAAVTAAGSLQRSIRSARGHAEHGPEHELAGRGDRLAALEAQADRALAEARHVGLVAETAAREAGPLARALGLGAFDPAQIAIARGDSPARRKGARGAALGETGSARHRSPAPWSRPRSGPNSPSSA